MRNILGLGPGSASRLSSSQSASPAPAGITSAPSVTEWQPPPPSTSDPYPGYYQKPSGEWAAYDPVYYTSFWKTWNLEAVDGARDKGKRKERGWEGADAGDVQSVDAHEEMLKSQLAEREATKNLTAAPNAPPAEPNMNIKVSTLPSETFLVSNFICYTQPRLGVMPVEGASFHLCWSRHTRIAK